MRSFLTWPRPAPDATLYSKADCSLCKEAEQAVRRVFGVRHVRVVDIMGDPHLEDAYVLRIPVLVVGDRELAEGRITVTDAKAARQVARTLQQSSDRA